jgi:hypothetical protein
MNHQAFLRHYCRLAVLVCALTSLLLGTTHGADAAASPLHLSVTEANYDRAQGRVAFTIRMQVADIESALSERAHRKISITDPGEFAPLALEYVRETLRLKSPRSEPLRLEWAGLDVTNTQVFLFFETSLTGGIQGARIVNTLLQERFPDQINSVQVRDGALKQTIVFAHDAGETAVDLKP